MQPYRPPYCAIRSVKTDFMTNIWCDGEFFMARASEHTTQVQTVSMNYLSLDGYECRLNFAVSHCVPGLSMDRPIF